MSNELSKIPYKGVGIGLRDEIADEIFSRRDSLEVLEIITERFTDASPVRMDFLKKFSGSFPIIPHGVGLSIGSAIGPSSEFLKKIKFVCEFLKADYYSEHFALTRLPETNFPEVEIGHLSPIWFTNETLNLVSDKIKKIQDYLGIPLVLENITSDFTIPEADYEEPEYISEICRRTECGLLLDLANIHIVSSNRGLEPIKWLERFPLQNAVQIHLAGGKIHDGWFYDTHSEKIRGINEGIWPLFEYAVKKSPIRAIIIERDENFKTDFEEMIGNDVLKARKILESRRSL